MAYSSRKSKPHVARDRRRRDAMYMRMRDGERTGGLITNIVTPPATANTTKRIYNIFTLGDTTWLVVNPRRLIMPNDQRQIQSLVHAWCGDRAISAERMTVIHGQPFAKEINNLSTMPPLVYEIIRDFDPLHPIMSCELLLVHGRPSDTSDSSADTAILMVVIIPKMSR